MKKTGNTTSSLEDIIDDFEYDLEKTKKEDEAFQEMMQHAKESIRLSKEELEILIDAMEDLRDATGGELSYEEDELLNKIETKYNNL